MALPGCGAESAGTQFQTQQEPQKQRRHECGEGNSVTGPTGDFSATVSRYEYELDLASGASKSSLFLDVPPPGGNCYLADAPPGVTGVKWNGMTPSLVETPQGGLHVCHNPTPAGQVKLEGHFTIPKQTYNYTQVGFSQRQDHYGNTFTYLLNWIESCDLFGLCDDSPDQLSNFTIKVTHGANDVVLCPGEITTNNARTVTFCELTATKGPTYSSLAVASNPAWPRSPAAFAAVPGQFELYFYEVPGGRLASSLNATSVTGYMNWIISQFGPLPYGQELRVAGAPTDWLGQEHPGNIIMREDLPDLRRDYSDMAMHTLMHEVAHQWAGDRTTLASAADFAWKEAIAEYMAYLYESQSRPAAEAVQTRTYWDRLARSAAYYPKPQDDPPPVFLSFASDVYGTGPMIFFLQLEPLLGQATVLAGIKEFLRMPGSRSVEDLRAALELVSHQDLGPYFDAWVYGSGDPDWPYFDVTATPAQEAGKFTVTSTQESMSGTVFPVSVDVTLKGATQSQTVTLNYGLAPTSATLSVTIPFPEPVVQVVVDPESRVVNRRFFGLIKEPKPERTPF